MFILNILHLSQAINGRQDTIPASLDMRRQHLSDTGIRPPLQVRVI